MAKRGTKGYEDEPEPNQIVGIGSFDSFTEIPEDDKKIKTQIGFIRDSRIANGTPPKRKVVTKRNNRKG